jgi:hypothetical protein
MIEPSQALRMLLEQHASLRRMVDDCEQLAEEVDCGSGDVDALAHDVARLRVTFEAHTQFEEQNLGSILRDLSTFAGVRINPMCADHIEEHRALAGRLSAPMAELRTTLDELRVHLAIEERYFTSARVRRAGLVP